jgi:hypothetical protein
MDLRKWTIIKLLVNFLSQHPVVSAIIMPSGGVVGLYLFDYFTNMGI